MKYKLILLTYLFMQIGIFGCAPFRDVGDNVGETIGEVTDELGKEQKVGKGDDGIIVHPQDDKKIKMAF